MDRVIGVEGRWEQDGERMTQEDKVSRRWYLLVIGLLYVGFIISSCLNVTLLLCRGTAESLINCESRDIIDGLADHSGESGKEVGAHGVNPLVEIGREFAYTTACLVQDPCNAGSYFSCITHKCHLCMPGSYQPQWGQTSCWPCPLNTTTDWPGAVSPTQCKLTECVRRSTPGLAIVESPNYPSQFPSQISCHWKVEPGSKESLLLILPSLSLPSGCTHTLSVKRPGRIAETWFTSCTSTTHPTMLTAEGGELWVDFTGTGNISAEGFQLSLLSVPDGLRLLIEAAIDEGKDYSGLDRIAKEIWGYNPKDQRRLSNLLSMLSPTPTMTDKKPLLEVVREEQRPTSGFVMVDKPVIVKADKTK